MAQVTVTMTIDTAALAEAIRNNTTPNFGSIISHSVTGGSVLKDPSDPNNSQKDTIVVWAGDSINLKFAPKDGDSVNPAKVCTFINFGVKNNGTNSLLRNISQVLGAAGGGVEKQLAATAGSLAGTLSYFITFTIGPNGRQFTFDPKLQVKIPTPE